MKKLTLTNHVQSDTTVLENEFIDRYMVAANGEYVKVYLLLLRHLNAPSGNLTISRIADILEITEKDVIRALNYWKKQGLLDYDSCSTQADSAMAQSASMTSSNRSTSASADAQVNFSAPEAKTSYSTANENVPNIEQYRSRKEFKELLFVAEQYLGKTLSHTDVDMITYFYESLNMSADLIEYLIEYCVENNHKSMHYIQKVALSWCERGITTVEEAKSGTALYHKTYYSVLNAFGIKGRAPATSEVEHINRWTQDYGFSMEIILNACARTINTIHQPSFDYTESILKRWHDNQVQTLQDVNVLDSGYMREKERSKKQTAKQASKSASTGSKFNNFEGRSYDMNDLERKLVQN